MRPFVGVGLNDIQDTKICLTKPVPKILKHGTENATNTISLY